MKNDMIESLGIYELRTLARKVGVQSPTTKKREELIALIKSQISSGESFEQKNKKGRPPKNLSSTDEFFDKIVSENEKKEFCSELVFRDSSDDKVIVSDASGTIEFEDDKFYIKNTAASRLFEFVELSKDFVKNNNLCVGDYIEAQSFGYENNSWGCAKKIYSINYDIKNKNLDINNIDIDKNLTIIKDIKQGERVLVCSPSNIRSTFESYLPYLKQIENNYKILIIANNVTPEEYIALTRSNSYIKFVTRFDDKTKKQENNIIKATNHIKQLLKYGENVFVIVYNIDDIISNINLLYMGYDKPSVESIEIIKKLLSLGKNIVGEASATICATYNKNNEDLLKPFDRIISKKITVETRN